MEKIKKTSKIIDRILTILLRVIAFCAVAAVITLVTFSVLLAKGIFPESATVELTLGSYVLTLAHTTGEQWGKTILLSIVNVTAGAAFACYLIWVLKRIFYPMSQGQPFSCSVSKAIRQIAWGQLIYGIAETILNILTARIYNNTFDIPSLFNSEKVISCTVSVMTDGNFLIWFVLLLLLSRVFQYGEQLQQLSDETL